MSAPRSFKLGQRTNDVWCGDIVTECEFISPLLHGGLLFWDRKFRVFRRAHWEVMHGEMVLNGWECSPHPFSS